jgi:hypothetical protein
MERAACEYDLDLVDLSTRLGVNLCNLTTRKEVETLHRRLEGDACVLVSERERQGLNQVILAYKRALEQKESNKLKK